MTVARERGRERRALALTGLVVVAAGLATRVVGAALGLDAIAGPAGDALYAALGFVLVAFVRPAARGWVVAAVAWGLCAAIELAQLTGVPAQLTALWWPFRLVLGTTFHAPDLIAYAVGALLAAVVDAGLARRVVSAPAPPPGSPRR